MTPDGRPRIDAGKLVAVIDRLAALLADLPDLVEVEINPLVPDPGCGMGSGRPGDSARGEPTVNDAVRVTRREAVLEVALDRPKANAIDAATSRLLGEVFTSFRDDPQLRVAIFTGTGERFFCAGWDLAAAAEGEAYESDYGVGGFGGFPELPGLDKPVIARGSTVWPWEAASNSSCRPIWSCPRIMQRSSFRRLQWA